MARDVRVGVSTAETARRIYGVVLRGESGEADAAETEALRRAVRTARLEQATPVTPGLERNAKAADWQPLVRIHETLEVGHNGNGKQIRCMRCGFLFGSPDENYKKRCLKRVVELDEIGGQRPASGDPYLGRYHEYICPGCATLLQVDLYCPELGGEEDLWDIHIEA